MKAAKTPILFGGRPVGMPLSETQGALVMRWLNSPGVMEALAELADDYRDGDCGSCIHLRSEHDSATGRCMRDNPTFGACPCEGWRPLSRVSADEQDACYVCGRSPAPHQTNGGPMCDEHYQAKREAEIKWREFQELTRFRGVTAVDQLTDSLREKVELVQALGDRADRLADGIAKLGSRAPDAARGMLATLQEQLRGLREELDRLAPEWNRLFDRATGVI